MRPYTETVYPDIGATTASTQNFGMRAKMQLRKTRLSSLQGQLLLGTMLVLVPLLGLLLAPFQRLL